MKTERYERQLADLQSAFVEDMVELRARKKLPYLLGNEDVKSSIGFSIDWNMTASRSV